MSFAPDLQPEVLLRHGTISINNSGQVVYTRDVDPSLLVTRMHAWVYLPEDAFGMTKGIYDLSPTGQAADPETSAGWDINMSGQIVGQVGAITNIAGQALLWQLGATITRTQLGYLDPDVGGAEYSVAYAINDATPPMIVGHSAVFWDPPCDFTSLAFRLPFGGDMEALSPVGPNNNGSYARDVNTPPNPQVPPLIGGFSGQSAGATFCPVGIPPCVPGEPACYWTRPLGEPTGVALAMLPQGGGHEVRGVNIAGQLVGQGYDSTINPGCPLHATLWENISASTTDLHEAGLIDPAHQSRAEAVNNRNPVQVVGQNISDERAYLWEKNASGDWNPAIDLDAELSSASWILVDAHDINDKGCIAGWGFLSGEVHAFLLYECPADCGNNDRVVNVVDFLALLQQWGQVGAACDIDGSGVGTTDFLTLLGSWGSCCKVGFTSPPVSVSDCIEMFGLEDPMVLEECICKVDPQQCQ